MMESSAEITRRACDGSEADLDVARDKARQRIGGDWVLKD